ncbi:MAG: hypothetical protein ACOCP8_02465 [archaeon]
MKKEKVINFSAISFSIIIIIFFIYFYLTNLLNKIIFGIFSILPLIIVCFYMYLGNKYCKNTDKIFLKSFFSSIFIGIFIIGLISGIIPSGNIPSNYNESSEKYIKNNYDNIDTDNIDDVIKVLHSFSEKVPEYQRGRFDCSHSSAVVAWLLNGMGLEYKFIANRNHMWVLTEIDNKLIHLDAVVLTKDLNYTEFKYKIIYTKNNKSVIFTSNSIREVSSGIHYTFLSQLNWWDKINIDYF